MQKTNITPHGEASWTRLPEDIQVKVLRALEASLPATQVTPVMNRPGVFALRVDNLKIIFSEHDSVRTIISVLTASEFDALGNK